MIKTHNVTGLKYLCKTERTGKAFDSYLGSGNMWRKHIKKHGKNVSTEILFETDNLLEFSTFALAKSIEFNIVESNDWANLVYETGQGGMNGASETTRAKISAIHKGIPKSEEQRLKMSIASKGRPKSTEHALKNGRKGKKHSPEFGRKISAANTGRIVSEATKEKLRNKIKSEEEKARISESMKFIWEVRRKPDLS